MQIKKFVAPTLKEATAQMKKELGDDAIVLSTRIIDNDPRYKNKRMFEITTGIEDNYDRSTQTQKQNEVEEQSKSFADELKNLSEKIFSTQQKKEVKPEPEFAAKTEIKKVIKEDNQIIERELKEIAETLVYREVQKRIVGTIIEQLQKYSDFLQPSNIDNYVISTIASMIPTGGFELNKKHKPTVIALVGPTGVGKTTCIAKLAVISKILHNLDIGLITLDTYRLGAIDQLKIFSEVSNIELRVAYEHKEITKFIQEFKKKDIVFIDTAGRSQNNTESLKETQKALSYAPFVDEIYLALSTTGTTKHMLDAAEKFKILNYNGIIFTKLDEAVSFGNILNVAVNTNVPIKYLTNGQVIPDDIIAADAEFIANMIYTGKINK